MANSGWLEISGAIVGLIGGSMGFITTAFHEITAKRQRNDELRKELCRAWTNEGDVSSTETNFVTVELCLYNGDLIGSMRS